MFMKPLAKLVAEPTAGAQEMPGLSAEKGDCLAVL